MPITRLQDAPRSSGPAGRPSQSECLISYFWPATSSLLCLLPRLFLTLCPSLCPTLRLHLLPLLPRRFRRPTSTTIDPRQRRRRVLLSQLCPLASCLVSRTFSRLTVLELTRRGCCVAGAFQNLHIPWPVENRESKSI